MWTEQQYWLFENASLKARYDVANPAGGLYGIEYGGEAFSEMRLLQCRNASAAGDADDRLVDHYVREDDLVSTFKQSPARANRKQVYLRSAGFHYPESLAGIEMIFSMQTQRLDGDPSLLVRSEFDAVKIDALVDRENPRWETLPPIDEAIDLPAERYCGVFLFELPGSETAYAQILDPCDFLGGRLIQLPGSPNRVSLSLPVFGTSLEKGVIRRGRATGLFLAKSEAREVVKRFYEWYRSSPPPLGA